MRPARASGPTSCACAAACSCRASSTGIPTPSSVICAAASRCALRRHPTTTSGRGASRCTPRPRRSIRAGCGPSPRSASTRAGAPATRPSASSTTSTTAPTGSPTRSPTSSPWPSSTAARAVGVRIVLLMAAYARGGAGRGPAAGQRRFCDRSVEAYLARVERLATQVAGDPLVTVGYAPHSLRAVPREWLVEIARHAAGTGYPAAHPRRRAAARGGRVARGVRPAPDRAPGGLRRARAGGDRRARHARLAR